MKRLFIILSLIYLISPAAKAQTAIKVASGKTVMIDSQMSANEWADAKTIRVSDEIKLHFKQSGEFVYICLEAPKQPHFWTDVYLADGGEIYNLHASAMLGERILRNGEFTPWDWWNNRGWTANAARILNSRKERPYLMHDVIEFQISRRRFTGEKWLMKFDFGIPDKTIFPQETSEKNTEKWLAVELGKAKFN